MTVRVSSLDELNEEIARLYYWFPVFLNLDFGDPPAIASVTVRTDNNAQSIWVPALPRTRLFLTRQSRQEEYVREALRLAENDSMILERKLLAASEYFYNAARLISLGETPGEFMAEALLNFAKILEVLFVKAGLESADAARVGLGNLGYSSEEIEWNFIPAIYLRNSLGVGHPRLAVLTADELEVVHEYADEAEDHFRQLLKRLHALPASERGFLQHESEEQSSTDLSKLVRKMREHRAALPVESRSTTITNPPPPVTPKSKY